MIPNIKKSKKATGEGAVGGMILASITAVIVLMLIIQSGKAGESKADVELCRTTNQNVVTSEFSVFWTTAFRAPVTCKTIVLDSETKVPTKKYKKGYRDSTGNDYRKEDVTAAEAEIADMIRKCWYMWLEGSSERVFPPGGWFGLGGRNGCFICYEFEISEKYGFNKPSLSESMNFLTIENRNDEKDETYNEYVDEKLGKRGGGLDIDVPIEFTGKFAITFHSYTPDWRDLWFGESESFIRVTSLDNARDCARNMLGQEEDVTVYTG